MSKRLTVREAAKVLGVCVQRITAKINSGHFKEVGKCECGHTTMIPTDEVYNNLSRMQYDRKKPKRNK